MPKLMSCRVGQVTHAGGNGHLLQNLGLLLLDLHVLGGLRHAF